MEEIKTFVLAILIISSYFTFTSCGKESESELQWGHLKKRNGGYDESKNWLINAPPGSTIAVCEKYGELAVAGLKKWSDPIDRTSRLNYVTNCNSLPRNAIRIYLKPMSPYEQGIAYADLIKMEIVYNLQAIQSAGINGGLESVLLHEMGHVWGLCDQYDMGNYTNCDYSSPGKTASNRVLNSVMGEGGRLELTSDDITGIEMLAKRDDLPGNAAWKSVPKDPEQPDSEQPDPEQPGPEQPEPEQPEPEQPGPWQPTPPQDPSEEDIDQGGDIGDIGGDMDNEDNGSDDPFLGDGFMDYFDDLLSNLFEELFSKWGLQ